MNSKFGVIAISLLISALAAPAWAGLSEPAAASDEKAGHTLSAPENGGSQAGIDSALDRFAGIASSDSSSEGARTPSLAITPPISETANFSAFTKVGSPMKAYYSLTGADNKQSIAAISQARPFDTAGGGDRFSFSDAGLAAFAQGHLAGSGDKWCDADFGQFHPGAANPGFFQNNDWHNDHPGHPGHPGCPGCPGGGQQSIPLPLPFLLTGSGLAALLALKKKAGING
jgi:hypothetical protein